MRVTREPELHERALTRRYDYCLEVVAVQYPSAELTAVQDRITADWDALEAEGFDLKGIGPDPEANRVDVSMITARTDHQAYFTARYGPAVRTFAVPSDERLECAKLDGYRVSSTGRSLVLLWTYSSGEELETVELTEHADRHEGISARRIR